MRSPAQILGTGAAWVTESELEMLVAALDECRRELDELLIFAAEMSGLISDLGDVPDPGLEDLPGMARAIRTWCSR